MSARRDEGREMYLRTLDSEEVDARLGRERFSRERLTTARWPVEQHAARRSDSEPVEGVPVKERPLDALPQFLLDVLLPTDVGPAGRGRLEEDFAHGRRPHERKRSEKVGSGESEGGQGREGKGRGREVGLDGERAGLSHERREVGADVAVRL